MEELIKKWKECNISTAEFEFYAGGDSMGDTELLFYDDKGKEIEMDEDFHSKIEDQIYANVNFYENSDGHYQGESGTVNIKLNEDDELQFDKNALAEYSNSYSDTIDLEMTQEEYDFVENYIDDFYKDEVDDITFSYKKDFFMSEELEATEKSVIDKIYDAYQDHEFETTDDCGDVGDYFTVSDLNVRPENKISFDLNYQVTEYETSDQ